MAAAVTVRRLSGFEDPSFPTAAWGALLATGETDTVFQTPEWQASWWASFGRGTLLLLLAERAGAPVALAPLFADGGMVFPVGAGGSDYLDLVGDTRDPEVVDALLTAARELTPGFVGFRFYLVLDDSANGERLAGAARRLGLDCFDEGYLPAPALDLSRPGAVEAAAGKKSLVRHERYFLHNGALEVLHLRDGQAILPHLPEFFEQHVDRWAQTPNASLFLDSAQRAFYQRLAERGGDAGWLRFTRLQWNGRPVAFHFGFCYRGVFLWYKPSFAIELARRSPGEALLRRLLLAAGEEGVSLFDFGLGDEAFKARFATEVRTVRTWGLYPRGGSAT